MQVLLALEGQMEYKPDKFEKNATRIILVIIVAAFGAALAVITIIRFSNPDEELFSSSNTVKWLIALIVFAIIGLSDTGSTDDKDNQE